MGCLAKYYQALNVVRPGRIPKTGSCLPLYGNRWQWCLRPNGSDYTVFCCRLLRFANVAREGHKRTIKLTGASISRIVLFKLYQVLSTIILSITVLLSTSTYSSVQVSSKANCIILSHIASRISPNILFSPHCYAKRIMVPDIHSNIQQ